MTTQTILSQMEILNESRIVIAHFMLVVYDDGGSEQARSKPHTVALAPDADLLSVLAAVNADITTRDGMKWPEIQAEDWARVTSHCTVEHTPEVVAAYTAYRSNQIEQQAKLASASIIAKG